MFYAVPTARVIFTAKTSFEVFSLKALLHYALFHSRFGFFLRFSSRLCYQDVGIQNANENARKMKVKHEKIQNTSPTRENVSISHYALGKNSSQLLAFCSRFAHKPYQNANPTHSVTWALVENKFGLFQSWVIESMR